MKNTILFGLATLLFAVLYIVFFGWTISLLWGWFIVPLGAQSLGIAHALGISTMIGLFNNPPQNITSLRGSLLELGLSLSKPLVCLILGFILSLLM